MKSKTVILFMAATLLILFAGYPEASRADDNCEKAESTNDIKQCHAKLYKKVDAELNTVYKKVAASMDKTGKAKLKKAQRAWIAFRDANAELMSDVMRGGTAEGILHSAEMIDMTEYRTKELQGLLIK